MKLRLPIVFSVLGAFLSVFSSPALALFQATSVARPSFQLDKFDTDLFTGSASYSYPINVPKGTNDLTPDVSLTYNSSATQGTSQVTGVAWQLNRDFIERDVN